MDNIKDSKIIAANSAASTDGCDCCAEYTLNGNAADANGNFAVTAAGIGAAASSHIHSKWQVDGLVAEMELMSPKTHTHDYVTGVSVDGDDVETLNSKIILEAGENISLDSEDGVVTVSATPFSYAQAAAVQDANTSGNIKFFVGTAEEWEDFQKDSNTEYLAFITE